MRRFNSFQQEPTYKSNFDDNDNLHFDDSTINSHTSFSKLSDIGKGSFGIVSQILYLPEMHLLAGKFLNPALVNDSTKRMIQSGVEQMCKISSDNIIKYYGCVTFEESLIILMEFCEHGSLRDILNEKKTAFSEDQISIILFDLLTAIQEIHNDHQIMHRDIKMSNLLLSSDSKIKITDLNLTNHFELYYEQPIDSSSSQAVGIVGTPYWMAPEVISKSEFSFPSDVWSIGITAVELSEGSPPYIEFTPSKAMINIVKNGFPGYRFPEKHSSEFKDFVSHCVEMDPSLRWTCEKLLDHPFIQRAKKLNRKKVLGDLIQIEIPHLKVNSNFLKKNKNKNNGISYMNSYNNQMFYNSVVASSIVPHPKNDKENENENESGNENDNNFSYKNYFNFSSIKNFNPFNASFKSVSIRSLSPKLQSLINRKSETESSKISSEKYFEYIDHSLEMDKKDENDMLNFISKAREMNSHLNIVPFEIATNQNAEISSIYITDKKKSILKKDEKVDLNSNMVQRLPLKIIIIVLLFFTFYSYGFNVTFSFSIIVLIISFLNYFVFSKK